MDVWEVLSGTWFLVLGYWIPGFLLLVLSRYISFSELEAGPAALHPGSQWLVLGIVLLGVYFIASGASSLVTAAIVISSFAAFAPESLEATSFAAYLAGPTISTVAGMVMVRGASRIAVKL